MKCRLTVHLSQSINSSLMSAARKPGGSKSSIVELALEQFLANDTNPISDASLLRRLDHMSRTMGRMARDGQVALEALALFVRYYLTITPPLQAEDKDAARALGHERFETFVQQIGKRLAVGASLLTEVMERLPENKADLFSTDADPASATRLQPNTADTIEADASPMAHRHV
jgi:hypothetical protein